MPEGPNKSAIGNWKLAIQNFGWGGWIRTNECRFQRPVPYHLATPQYQTASLESVIAGTQANPTLENTRHVKECHREKAASLFHISNRRPLAHARLRYQKLQRRSSHFQPTKRPPHLTQAEPTLLARFQAPSQRSHLQSHYAESFASSSSKLAPRRNVQG